MSANSGLLLAFLYYLYNRYVQVIANEVAIPLLILIIAISTITCAFMYDITFDGCSFVLYIFMFISGCVGNLMYQILYPFLVKYQAEYMIAARAGNDFANAVMAFIALAQSPGSSAILFSPTWFLLGVGGYLLVFPITAYLVIIRYEIGLKAEFKLSLPFSLDSDKFNLLIEDDDVDAVDIELYEVDMITVLETEKKDSAHGEVEEETDCADGEEIRGKQYGSLLPSNEVPQVSMKHVVSKGLVCIDLEESDLKLERTVSFLPQQFFLLLTVVWVDFNNWGFMSNLLPFAMTRVSSSEQEGSMLLAYALQLSSLCLVLGDLSTYLFKLPIPLCLFIFTCIAFAIYSAALGLEIFQGYGILIVLLFGSGRFIEAHLTTSVFNHISSSFPEDMKEDAIRFVGLADMIAVTLGVTISSFIVDSYFPCSGVSLDDYIGGR